MLFEIYQDIKNLVLKSPENILSLMALILGLFLPGLLQLCINEREMFLLLDPIRVLLYALTFAGFESLLSLSCLVLMNHYFFQLDLLATYIFCILIGACVIAYFSNKEGEEKTAHIQKETNDTCRKESESEHQD